MTGAPAPARRWLSAVWGSRELIRTLARKDFFVRYRRAAFGLLWAIAVPLLQALVLAFVIQRFVKFPSVSPFPVYVFGGTAAWAFFGAAVGAGSTAIVDGSALSTRIYFPRAVLPAVAVVANAYALVPSLALLVGWTWLEGVDPSARILLVVPAAALLVVLALCLTLVLSAAHVYSRDIRYLVQAALIPWFYLTPIFYPLSAIDERYADLIRLNPVTGCVELVHEATVGGVEELGLSVLATVGWCILLGVIAVAVHRRADRTLVDLL